MIGELMDMIEHELINWGFVIVTRSELRTRDICVRHPDDKDCQLALWVTSYDGNLCVRIPGGPYIHRISLSDPSIDQLGELRGFLDTYWHRSLADARRKDRHKRLLDYHQDD